MSAITSFAAFLRFNLTPFRRSTFLLVIRNCKQNSSDPPCTEGNPRFTTFVWLSSTEKCVFKLIKINLYSAENSNVHCDEVRLYVSQHSVHLHLKLNTWNYARLESEFFPPDANTSRLKHSKSRCTLSCKIKQNFDNFSFYIFFYNCHISVKSNYFFV